MQVWSERVHLTRPCSSCMSKQFMHSLIKEWGTQMAFTAEISSCVILPVWKSFSSSLKSILLLFLTFLWIIGHVINHFCVLAVCTLFKLHYMLNDYAPVHNMYFSHFLLWKKTHPTTKAQSQLKYELKLPWMYLMRVNADIEPKAECKLKLTRATDRAGMNSSLGLEREGRTGGDRLEKRRRRRLRMDGDDRLIKWMTDHSKRRN